MTSARSDHAEAEPDANAPDRSRRRALALTLGAGVAAGGGPAVLHWMAGFGQSPPDRLPLAAVILLGVVVAGPLTDLVVGLPRRRSHAWLLVAGAAGVIAATALLVLAGGHASYLLAPLAAASGAALLKEARPHGLAQAVAVYVACTLLANFTLDSFLPLGSFLLVNVGTLFFGITFTQRDRVHRFGRSTVYRMILFAAVMNVVLAAALGTPLRYVAVSFLSIVLAETADTEVFQFLRGRRWIVRVAGSNAVSAPLDTAIFTLLAFWGEDFATREWLTRVIVTDVAVKYASGILAAIGVIALVRSALPPPPGRPAARVARSEAADSRGGTEVR